MKRRVLVPVALALVIVLAGCGTARQSRPLQLELGDVLIRASQQFVRTSALYRTAREAELLTDAEWAAWTAFGEEFQRTYDRAYKAWLVGSGTAAADRAELEGLIDQIAIFALKRAVGR